MLGCHEFCGYYEWTFHDVRRTWGQRAVARLWAEAIGGDSQRHYRQAGLEAGLAGLCRTWVKTGEEESCDWTFTLDEARNVLRFDMRQCPSKGFLLANDLNADEDYCDHCMGWMAPLLEQVGVEVWEHEHNHCGQCWATLRRKDRPSEPLELEADVRRDPRWKHGYLDRWEHNEKQPIAPATGPSTDPCEALASWFREADGLVVIGEAAALDAQELRGKAGLLADRAYAAHGDLGLEPFAVLIDHADPDLAGVARRFLAADEARRPLLLYAWFPRAPRIDLAGLGLPRALPVLPLLIRSGLYVHRPGEPYPSGAWFLAALAKALGKPVHGPSGLGEGGGVS